MDAQIWVLQDKTSPTRKVWGLIVVEDGATFAFYGSTFTPNLKVNAVARKKGLAMLAEKQKKYQKSWCGKIEIQEGEAVDFCEKLYNVFFKIGSANQNVVEFLDKHRSKAPDRQAAARERANKRISAAIQKVPTLP